VPPQLRAAFPIRRDQILRPLATSGSGVHQHPGATSCGQPLQVSDCPRGADDSCEVVMKETNTKKRRAHCQLKMKNISLD
jgi:hypothetical protein